MSDIFANYENSMGGNKQSKNFKKKGSFDNNSQPQMNNMISNNVGESKMFNMDLQTQITQGLGIRMKSVSKKKFFMQDYPWPDCKVQFPVEDYSERELSRFNNDGSPRVAQDIKRMRAKFILQDKNRA